MKKALSTVILLLICIGLIVSALVLDNLSNRIDQLEIQLATIQDQTLALSKDQLRITDAFAAWLEAWQVDMFESSAYSPLDDQNGLNRWGNGEYMASGVKTSENLNKAIAVDPDVIPLGTRIWVQGEGWKVAQDIGRAIEGKRIDLPKRTYEEAIQHGRQDIMVIYPKNI